MKIYYVEWQDAGCETHAQMTLEDAQKLNPMPCSNVGYMLFNDSKKIIMSFGTIEDIDKKCRVYNVIMVIPKSCVIKMEIIKEVKGE